MDYKLELQNNNIDLQTILDIINTLPEQSVGGGDTSAEDAIITKTITEYSNDRVDFIGVSAFCKCKNLTTINFPICTNIENYAFYDCTSLTTADFPAVTNIGNSVFYSCSNLATISFPVCISIGNSAFYNCSRLTTADFPAVTNIGSCAFYNCSRLTTADFPDVTNIGNSAFYGCSNLATISFPVCISIGSCAFYNCSRLTTADFHKLAYISREAFRNCSSLTALIVRTSNSVCTLSGSSWFNYTPIYSNTGYIYVVSSLIDSYKTATNWSTYANQFRALEDYTVDGTITGALDETKI